MTLVMTLQPGLGGNGASLHLLSLQHHTYFLFVVGCECIMLLCTQPKGTAALWQLPVSRSAPVSGLHDAQARHRSLPVATAAVTGNGVVHKAMPDDEGKPHDAYAHSKSAALHHSDRCRQCYGTVMLWGGSQGADLSLALLSQLVNQSGTGDCLAGAGRALNETEGRLQHCLHCIHLHTHNKHPFNAAGKGPPSMEHNWQERTAVGSHNEHPFDIAKKGRIH